jgi:hypothetical protein
MSNILRNTKIRSKVPLQQRVEVADYVVELQEKNLEYSRHVKALALARLAVRQHFAAELANKAAAVYLIVEVAFVVEVRSTGENVAVELKWQESSIALKAIPWWGIVVVPVGLGRGLELLTVWMLAGNFDNRMVHWSQ